MGPTSPNAGPTFPSVDAEAPIADTKSKPHQENTRDPTIKANIYSTKKLRILDTTVSEMALLLKRTGRIALGCKLRLKSKMLFFNMIRWCITFIPPEVEPPLAPKNMREKNIKVRKGVHTV